MQERAAPWVAIILQEQAEGKSMQGAAERSWLLAGSRKTGGRWGAGARVYVCEFACLRGLPQSSGGCWGQF